MSWTSAFPRLCLAGLLVLIGCGAPADDMPGDGEVPLGDGGPNSWWGSSRLTGSGPDATTPNIVVFLLDDLGFADVEPYCRNCGATHPNILELARRGVWATSFYAPSSVCSPTRASLLTGQTPNRHGLTRVLMPAEGHGIPPRFPTIAQRLPSGYTRAAIGKWHLGTARGFGPGDKGFDRWYMLPYSNDLHVPWLLSEGFAPNAAYPNLEAGGAYPDPLTFMDGLAQAADRVITERGSDPFFLYIAPTAPHMPLFHRGERITDPACPGAAPADLYDRVTEDIDWLVGQVMQSLLDHGAANDTMVIFTSDNGAQLIDAGQSPTIPAYPWLATWNELAGGTANYGAGPASVEAAYGCPGRQAGRWVGGDVVNSSWHTRTGPLRPGAGHGKGSVFEGGTRVPFIAYWAGHWDTAGGGDLDADLADGRTDAPFSVIDLLPTLLAEIPGSDAGAGEGIDVAAILAAPTTASLPPRPIFLSSPRYGGQLAVRKGKLKLHLRLTCSEPGICALTTTADDLYNVGWQLTADDECADDSQCPSGLTCHRDFAADARGLCLPSAPMEQSALRNDDRCREFDVDDTPGGDGKDCAAIRTYLAGLAQAFLDAQFVEDSGLSETRFAPGIRRRIGTSGDWQTSLVLFNDGAGLRRVHVRWHDGSGSPSAAGNEELVMLAPNERIVLDPAAPKVGHGAQAALCATAPTREHCRLTETTGSVTISHGDQIAVFIDGQSAASGKHYGFEATSPARELYLPAIWQWDGGTYGIRSTIFLQDSSGSADRACVEFTSRGTEPPVERCFDLAPYGTREVRCIDGTTGDCRLGFIDGAARLYRKRADGSASTAELAASHMARWKHQTLGWSSHEKAAAYAAVGEGHDALYAPSVFRVRDPWLISSDTLIQNGGSAASAYSARWLTRGEPGALPVAAVDGSLGAHRAIGFNTLVSGGAVDWSGMHRLWDGSVVVTAGGASARLQGVQLTNWLGNDRSGCNPSDPVAANLCAASQYAAGHYRLFGSRCDFVAEPDCTDHDFSSSFVVPAQYSAANTWSEIGVQNVGSTPTTVIIYYPTVNLFLPPCDVPPSASIAANTNNGSSYVPGGVCPNALAALRGLPDGPIPAKVLAIGGDARVVATANLVYYGPQRGGAVFNAVPRP